ncbi:MAG: hypothetical protein N2260_07625 [Syntrophobacterales bacterium]|nr:hypothetical protein [Syntrophobacterales bacterium]
MKPKDVDREEYERKKRAIFESMSKRGKERILKMGYENWDPFQEPKDPREIIFSSSAQQAINILKEFYEVSGLGEAAVDYHRELFEIVRGFLNGDRRARVIVSLCAWIERRTKEMA